MIGAFLRSRRQAARNDPHTVRLDRPVISIGNISMGGRGKTPLTALVARLLVDAGEKPAILSRGYGRAIADAGVTVVSDGRTVLSDLAHSGDEPLMLARAVPGAAVVVCEQRALAGTLAECALGCTVHILDDGFQHHQLHRDLDIVLVTAEDFSARVMPFGKLREPVESLQDADAILSDGAMGQLGNGAVGQWGSGAIGFSGSLVRRLGPPSVPIADGGRVFAVAGIARPERFFTSLNDAGYDVAGTMGFNDHHRFTAADVARISAEAARAGAAAVVTTSKDAIRLEGFGPWAVPLVEIPLEVRVDPDEAFRTWLLSSLRHHHRS